MANLYFVPTPIGDYKDMTIRGVEVLNNSDMIYCNDISESQPLLSYYNIVKPLYCYKGKILEIIQNIEDDKIISIISDEGYSGIDDDSYELLNIAIQKKINLEVIPGANFLLTGLVSSGIPCDKFLYYGFLNSDNKKDELTKIIDFDKTLVFYEYQENIEETLQILSEVFGKRNGVLCISLTLNEEKFIHFVLGDEIVIPETNKRIVIVIEGAKKNSAIKALNDMKIEEHYKYYLEQGFDSKEAMKKVAKDRGVSKSDIYKVVNC